MIASVQTGIRALIVGAEIGGIQNGPVATNVLIVNLGFIWSPQWWTGPKLQTGGAKFQDVTLMFATVHWETWVQLAMEHILN